jgi:hypothetical protein
MSQPKWVYGVTTCAQRLETHLPQTLASLARAGFDKPRLFVDGAQHLHSPWQGCPHLIIENTGLEVTCRYPQIHAWGNWFLGLQELHIRNPEADRFAMFQDDLTCCANLREYLERCPYPDGAREPRRPWGYWNLYTALDNWRIVPKVENEPIEGWYLANQGGKGALGLVFNREAVWEVLSFVGNVRRCTDPTRGYRNIDGAVVEALSHQRQCKEYVHFPSLLQHTGEITTITKDGKPPNESGMLSPCWYGPEYSPLGLLTSR